MKRKNISDDQSVGIVKQVENVLPMEECYRQHGISTKTFFF